MVKREYSKQDIVDLTKRFDKRANQLTPAQIDDVINFAYAELASAENLFTDEVVIPADQYYDAGELKFTIDIEEDVVYIYDLYVTIENQDPFIFEHGIEEVKNANVIYKDNREVGRAHVDLTMLQAYSKNSAPADNIIIKYFLTPASSTENVYMDQPTYLALKNALGTALYDYLNDVPRAMQKLSAMDRTAKAAIPNDPEDLLGKRPSMFPYGV